MIELQKFIDNLYKNHPNEELGECKFRNVISIDAIVMRFSSKEHYEEFLKLLDENSKIKNSFIAPIEYNLRTYYGVVNSFCQQPEILKNPLIFHEYKTIHFLIMDGLF